MMKTERIFFSLLQSPLPRCTPQQGPWPARPLQEVAPSCQSPPPPTPVSQLRRVGGGRSGGVLKSRWLQLDGRGHRKRLLFIPGTVAKGFQKYLAEIFYCPACLQPVIMRSRCLMCANALAAFARENPSRERRSGKSGDNYVVQSQTLFCSYCKRPWPPLQEARKTESDS